MKKGDASASPLNFPCNLLYYFLSIWISTKAPTRPNKPFPSRLLSIPIILSTTDIFSQKGIPTPPNSTSSTIPSAITEIPISVSLLAQEPILVKISIKYMILVKQNVTNNYEE